MSLINDALKKAQKQRTGEDPTLSAPSPFSSERPANLAHRPKPPGLNVLLVRLALGGGALVIVILAGVLVFRDKGTPTPPPATSTAATTPVATVPAPAVESPKPATTVAAATVTPPPPAVTPPAATTAFVVPTGTPAAPTKATPTIAKTETSKSETPKPEAPKPEPVRPVPAPTVVATVEPPVAAPVKPVELPKPAEPPPKLEPRAINFIESIRVAGIRASASDSRDSKVLMNDRVYRIGNIVEAQMGLRLVEITNSSLTFEDEQGARYTRNF